MRISGDILDRLLNIYIPIAIVYYFLSFLIPDRDFHFATSFGRLYFFIGIVILWILLDVTRVFFRKIKTLTIDTELILGNKRITADSIQSIHFVNGGKFFDMVKLTIQQDGKTEDIAVMDKPKLFGFIGGKGSKTLSHLYYYFPQLQEKEIKTYR